MNAKRSPSSPKGVGIALDVLTLRREGTVDERLDTSLASNRAKLAWISRFAEANGCEPLSPAAAD